MHTSLPKIAIGLFCVWHMFAVAEYSLPDSLQDTQLAKWVDTQIGDTVDMYVLSTSQWQNWPLFAPDPMRRVLRYDIDARLKGQWTRIDSVGPGTTFWWNSSKELKILHRLLANDDRQQVRRYYLQQYCRTLHLEPGTPLRLTIGEYIMPKHDQVQSVDWWHQYEPQWTTRPDVETICPLL